MRVAGCPRAHTNELSGVCFTLSSLVLHKITQSIFEAIVEQAPLAIEDLMNELDAQSGEGEGSDEDDGDDDSDEASEDEQDLQDTAPKNQPAGEVPRTVLSRAGLLEPPWLFAPEPHAAWHEVHLVYSPKSVSALDSQLSPGMLLSKA